MAGSYKVHGLLHKFKDLDKKLEKIPCSKTGDIQEF